MPWLRIMRNGNDRIGNGNDEAFFLILMLLACNKASDFLCKAKKTDDDG